MRLNEKKCREEGEMRSPPLASGMAPVKQDAVSKQVECKKRHFAPKIDGFAKSRQWI